VNVVPFPRRMREPGSSDAEREAFLVIAALRRLGEPATLDEIRRFLASLPEPGLAISDVRLPMVLERFSDGGLEGLQATPLFRCVSLRGAPAWAFTQVFRATLHQVGISTTLRPYGAPSERSSG
jgi:hypothetical protein